MRGFAQAELAIGLSMFALGLAAGYKLTADHYDAVALDAERAANKQYRAEVERGNGIAGQLITAEGQIRTIATWKSKNAPIHTTGKPCLSAGAVGLLNAGPNGLPQTSGKHDAEDAGGLAATESQGATDADVLDWTITAQEQYRTCAKRHNGFVDFEAGR